LSYPPFEKEALSLVLAVHYFTPVPNGQTRSTLAIVPFRL